jgi:transcriptional regulator with XRE-family HTH domain
VSAPSFHQQPEAPERLKAALQAKVGTEHGWSARVGERLGVHHTTVTSWCRGDQKPSLGYLVAIADMTGSTLDWLVRGKP